jgi:F-type H+-transporting ATPase subunit b
MEALTQGLQGGDIVKLLLTNIVAFLIFVAILGKVAWGPLMGVLDARKERIRSDYATAHAKVEEAEHLRRDFQDRLQGIQNTERERVQEAVKRGEGLAKAIESEARAKAAGILGKAESDLERDVIEARLTLRAQVVTMAIGAAEMLVKEKLDDAKHRQLVESFIQGLGDIRA